MASSDEMQRQLTVGFPVWHLVWHLGRYCLARHLVFSLSDGLLVEALGLFLLLDACRPDSLTVRGTVCGLHEGSDQVYGNGQDYGRVLLACDLAHRLKQPQLQRCRALQPVCRLPESL